MTIEWKSLPQSEALAELKSGLEWRRDMLKALQELGPDGLQPQQRIETRGRKPSSNGSEFPQDARGALDPEVSS
jgi:hypothetical protein